MAISTAGQDRKHSARPFSPKLRARQSIEQTAQDTVLASWAVYVSLGDLRVSGCQAAATDPMEGQAVGYSEARILSHRVCQSPYAQRDAEGMRHDAILPQLSLDLVLFGDYGASGCELVHAR